MRDSHNNNERISHYKYLIGVLKVQKSSTESENIKLIPSPYRIFNLLLLDYLFLLAAKNYKLQSPIVTIFIRFFSSSILTKYFLKHITCIRFLYLYLL